MTDIPEIENPPRYWVVVSRADMTVILAEWEVGKKCPTTASVAGFVRQLKTILAETPEHEQDCMVFEMLDTKLGRAHTFMLLDEDSVLLLPWDGTGYTQ